MAVLPYFSDNKKDAPQAAPNMFAPPSDTLTSTSAKAAPAPVGFVKDTTESFIPSGEKMTNTQRAGQAALGGMEAGASVRPTESTVGAVGQALGSAAQGALTGAMVGGPVGAAVGGGVGLLMGGLNAFMGNQAARKERDRINAFNREAAQLNAEAIMRDEKWKQTYHLTSLEQARYERQKYNSQAAWERSQVQGKNMLSFINNNSALKDKWAKQGWV